MQLVRSLPTGRVVAMALSQDGRTLATADNAGVKMWDTTSGQMSEFTNVRRVWSLSFSPDGRFLATAGSDQLVRLWDVAARQQIQQFRGHGSEVVSVNFSADGKTLVSGSKDKTARLWSIGSSREVTTVTNVTTRHIFSPDGRLDRKSTRLNSSHIQKSRMPSSA